MYHCTISPRRSDTALKTTRRRCVGVGYDEQFTTATGSLYLNLLQNTLPEPIETAEMRDQFIEFENEDLEVTAVDKLIGDGIAPYFVQLTP